MYTRFIVFPIAIFYSIIYFIAFLIIYYLILHVGVKRFEEKKMVNKTSSSWLPMKNLREIN